MLMISLLNPERGLQKINIKEQISFWANYNSPMKAFIQ